jgi:ABC-2 type transport system ATP-binding protein
MIQARGLTKLYGETRAVDDLSFTVRPGVVTGFLGPNGAGKSTTMRMILGLDAPTAGKVTVNGRPYAEHRAPLREVGALLEARAVHTSRTAINHLRAMAATTGIGRRRVQEVIDLVGLREVANDRAGRFSLGMGQRLGIASALLGDPSTLVLDEPANGLDPEGVRWIRNLLKELAAEGRTIFLSSHLMSEMALTADQLIVIGRGKLISETSVAEVIASASTHAVRVRTPDDAALRDLLLQNGASVAGSLPGRLEVTGMTSDEVGYSAAAAGLTLLELTPIEASLEDAFMAMTQNAVDYRTPSPATAGADTSLERTAS